MRRGLHPRCAVLAPSWYLTLFQRILDTSEIVPALSALTSRKVQPLHVSLGIVLASEAMLLESTSFEQAAGALCGAACTSRCRRAPRGVMEHAAQLATMLPPEKLDRLRADASDKNVASGNLMRASSAETPRARQATRRWFESPWASSKKLQLQASVA